MFFVLYFTILGCIVHGYVVEMSIKERLEIQELAISTGSCEQVDLVSRAEWGARKPKAVVKMYTPVTVLFIHHTDTNECYSLDSCESIMRGIQNFHMDVRGWNDIAYNFLVGQDGRVYEGRNWDAVGSHTLGWNNVAVAFSVIGNYTSHVPDDAAITAINNMIQCGIDKNKLTNDYKLYGHRDVRNTSCPGESFYNLIRTWSHFGPLPPVKPTPTPPIFGPDFDSWIEAADDDLQF